MPTLKTLLEAKADPNYKRGDGRTALHLAIANSVDEIIVETLLKHKADPCELDSYGDIRL